MKFDSDNTRASKDVKDIPMLYNRLMGGYTSDETETHFQRNEDGSFMELYAPGYDNNGIAEISAMCL